jgi:glycosyltransferase involved in cell wall biosynthesis
VKIALISDGIYPYVIGGMQKHSSSIGVELVKLGYSVDLYHFVLKGNSIPTTDEVNRFHFNSTNGFNKTYCLYFPTSIRFPGHYLWNSYRYSKSVFEIIKNNNASYDLIYSKGFSSWRLLQKQKELRIKPKIGVKFHGYEMYQFSPNLKIKMQHFMLRPFVKKLNNKADYVFSYGGKITNIIKDLGVPNNKIIEIPSAINKSWLYDKKLNISKSIKFLFVGRFERRKGIEEINKAILNLPINNVDIEFHFVGSIPAKNQIKRNDFKIIYYGEIIDEESKKKIYDKCDILMCPSYSEGMPNVILEAMSRGLAIMATDVGAVRLLVSEDNGILLNNSNEILIRKAICKIILMDKKLILNMKENSIKIIKENFLWQNIIYKFLDIFGE